MRKAIVWIGACALALALAGCGGTAPQTSGGEPTARQEPAKSTVGIKQSPDKYTWYVKNYVGMNAASVGYTALDGSRRDAYGSGTMKIVFRTPDGTYLDYDVKNEDGETDENSDKMLRDYVVTGQDLEPNTEIKYTFQLDENGEEYDNLVDSQNYEEIVLSVAKVGSNQAAPDLTVIEPAPDKYTRYVKDYVGRNLATCGYYSLGGTYNDHYGSGYVKFDIMADDGSYIDVSDGEALKQFVVTSQSVEPNTAITMTFMTDENGVEYSNLVQSQSLESITLSVSRVEE